MSILLQKNGAASKGFLLEKKSEEGKHPTRFYSKIQENSVASATGGQRNLNSGATMFIKGDCVTEQWLLECKTKTKHSKSISIQKEWIDKNKEEALFMGKPYSAVVFNFGPNEQNYYIIDEYMFNDLQEYLKSKGDI